MLKKEQNARKRKLTKEIQTIEERIALLETQKKELDSILLDPALYNNRERAVEINKQHKTIIQELSTLYNGWEAIHAELESANDNQCDPV